MYTKVMQGTTDFHYTIADAHLAEATHVVDDATALTATVGALEAHAGGSGISIEEGRAARSKGDPAARAQSGNSKPRDVQIICS